MNFDDAQVEAVAKALARFGGPFMGSPEEDAASLDRTWRRFIPEAQVALEAASRTPPVHLAPKRWLVEEHLSSGSIRWRAYEHELQARSEAAMCAAPATVTPLYVHPAPVGERDKALDEAAQSVLTAGCAHYAATHPGHTRGPSEQEVFHAAAIRALKTQQEG